MVKLQFNVFQSNITSMFLPERESLKINKNNMVIRRLDLRNPKKVVCILAGLHLKERLFHHEMFMTLPFNTYSHLRLE